MNYIKNMLILKLILILLFPFESIAQSSLEVIGSIIYSSRVASVENGKKFTNYRLRIKPEYINKIITAEARLLENSQLANSLNDAIDKRGTSYFQLVGNGFRYQIINVNYLGAVNSTNRFGKSQDTSITENNNKTKSNSLNKKSLTYGNSHISIGY